MNLLQSSNSQQDPTLSSGVVIADDALWKTEVTESQGEWRIAESDNSKPESNQPNVEDTTSKEQTKLDHADGEAVATDHQIQNPTTMRMILLNRPTTPPNGTNPKLTTSSKKKRRGQVNRPSVILGFSSNKTTTAQNRPRRITQLKWLMRIRDDDALWKVGKSWK
jgi:CO dehydrogenase/acetyl-CoA synthase alpha subunit